jgi:hypothetical protein
MAACLGGHAAMIWWALQVGVFTAVHFANIYFELGMDNGYAVSVLGVFAAICATYLVSMSIDLLRWWRQRRLGFTIRHDGGHSR